MCPAMALAVFRQHFSEPHLSTAWVYPRPGLFPIKSTDQITDLGARELSSVDANRYVPAGLRIRELALARFFS